MAQYKCVAVSVYLLRCCPLPVFFLFYCSRAKKQKKQQKKKKKEKKGKEKKKGKFLKGKRVLIRCNEMKPKYKTMAGNCYRT